WVGSQVLILPGSVIGEGSIVSAHSVVAGTVAPYTIVAGNPARRIGVLTPPPERAHLAPPPPPTLRAATAAAKQAAPPMRGQPDHRSLGTRGLRAQARRADAAARTRVRHRHARGGLRPGLRPPRDG